MINLFRNLSYYLIIQPWSVTTLRRKEVNNWPHAPDSDYNSFNENIFFKFDCIP